MTDLMQLEKLVEMIKVATGPDDALDREVAAALLGVSCPSDEGGNSGGYNLTPRRIKFTSSLNACDTLRERLFPGSEWGVDVSMDKAAAFVSRKEPNAKGDRVVFFRPGKTAPLALLLAIVTAALDKEENHDP